MFIFNTRNVFSSPSTPHVDRHPITSAWEWGNPPGGRHPSHVLHKEKMQGTPDPALTRHATLTCPCSASGHIQTLAISQLIVTLQEPTRPGFLFLPSNIRTRGERGRTRTGLLRCRQCKQWKDHRLKGLWAFPNIGCNGFEVITGSNRNTNEKLLQLRLMNQ